MADANKLSDFPDFNDAAKLGNGKEMVDRLTNLIAIFENPALDFSKNRAEGDDILGDAYEYPMRHFATESEHNCSPPLNLRQLAVQKRYTRQLMPSLRNCPKLRSLSYLGLL